MHGFPPKDVYVCVSSSVFFCSQAKGEPSDTPICPDRGTEQESCSGNRRSEEKKKKAKTPSVLLFWVWLHHQIHSPPEIHHTARGCKLFCHRSSHNSHVLVKLSRRCWLFNCHSSPFRLTPPPPPPSPISDILHNPPLSLSPSPPLTFVTADSCVWSVRSVVVFCASFFSTSRSVS